MSTTSRDIRLNVTAEVQKYVAEMAKIPGTTQAQAAAAGRKLAAELAKAEVKAVAHSRAAADDAGKAWNRAAQAAGGVWGELAGRIDNASQALGGGAGLIAVSGVALFAVGKLTEQIGRMAAAVYEAAFAYRDAAEAQGRLLDPETLAGLASVEASTRRISDANGELAASIVSGAAPAVSRFSSLWEDFVTGAGAAASAWVGAFTWLWGGLITQIDRAIDSTGLFGQTVTAYVDVALGGAVDSGTSWMDQIDATVESMGRMRRETADTTTEIERQTTAVRAVTQVISEYEKLARIEAANTQRTKREMEAEYTAALAEQLAVRAALEAATVEKIKSDALASTEAQRMAEEQLQAQRASARSANVSSAQAMFGALSQIARKGSIEQALLARGGALFSIAANTAVAATKALAELGPIFGPPAAGLMIAAGALQGAAVASEPLPKFALGGVVGGDAPLVSGRGDEERLITARRGEMVLTPDQQAALGSPVVNVNTYYDGRLHSRVLQDDMRRSGPLSRLLRPRGVSQRRDRGLR